MEINKNHVGGGVLLGAAVLCGLSRCNDEEKKPHAQKSAEVSRGRSKIEKTVRSVFEDEPEEDSGGDDEDYKVEVKLDENGNVAWNWDSVAEIRDCVESTGLYHCNDISTHGQSVCSKEDPEEGQHSIYIEPTIVNNWYRPSDGWRNNVTIRSAGHGFYEDVQIGENDDENLNTHLSAACKLVVEKLETTFDESDVRFFDEVNELSIANSTRFEASNSYYDLIVENGLEIVDDGGGVFVVEFGNGRAAKVLTDIYYADLAKGEWNHEFEVCDFHGWCNSYDTEDEAVEYLLETREELSEK